MFLSFLVTVVPIQEGLKKVMKQRFDYTSRKVDCGHYIGLVVGYWTLGIAFILLSVGPKGEIESGEKNRHTEMFTFLEPNQLPSPRKRFVYSYKYIGTNSVFFRLHALASPQQIRLELSGHAFAAAEGGDYWRIVPQDADSAS